ncbi:MAG: hypothetical protein GY732_12175, partial [Gammaproteobacteria bacterium]|nr:hypothetical protein [Gammaproteobacteria bacterium]
PDAGQLPIIAMTAHALDEERKKCQGAGMNAHISKPVDVDLLLSELAGWLGIAATETASGIGINIESSGTVTDTSTEFDSEPSINTLPNRVPGIDLADGLARLMGNHDIYTRLLHGFPEQHGALLDTIREAIDAGNRTEVTRAAHTLAGSAGNLSMMPLRKAARALEQGDASEDTMKFLEQRFHEVVESIDGLNLKQPMAGSGAIVGSLPGEVALDITPLLQELSAMLSSNDMGAKTFFRHLMQSVGDEATSDTLQPVGEHIAKLDYPEALRLLKRLSI